MEAASSNFFPVWVSILPDDRRRVSRIQWGAPLPSKAEENTPRVCRERFPAMALRITPEDNSHTRFSAEPLSQDQGFVQSDRSELEPEYVPEREFVLMPFFRRIGQMLGLRKQEQAEYLYVPETAGPQVRAEMRAEAMPAVGVKPELHAIEPVAPAAFEDVLGLDQEIEPEPVAADRSWSSEPQSTYFEAPVELAPEPVHIIEAPQAPVVLDTKPREIEPEPQITRLEPIVAIPAVMAEPLPSATQPGALSHQEAIDLAAQVREAASKISAAVAQAAEWLHNKEAEILRRAELPLAPEKPVEQTADVVPIPQRLTVQSSAPSEISEREESLVPALQREAAWRQERRNVSQKGPIEIPVRRTPKAPKFRRQFVLPKAATLAFWKRVDWSREFTPKRVAVLGAFAMAILMILGISLARHPSELPQQTRRIEPGGVTLTTHTAAPVAQVPAQPQQAVSARPTTHAAPRRASGSDDGPEVVTHYYGKPKPSPVHPSTSAGVRHYSDLESR